MLDAYTSGEMIPSLDMQCTDTEEYNDYINTANNFEVSSRSEIREAFRESSDLTKTAVGMNGVQSQQPSSHSPHGRSSGSGCSIVRLTGEDATSIRGLVDYANKFFERVDNINCEYGDAVRDVGVFRIANNVYAGFDENVNGEDKMQFLDTRIFPSVDDNTDNDVLVPMEVGNLVGEESLNNAHRGMKTLLDIGSQITVAVLGMDSSAEKLIDDGTHVNQHSHLKETQPQPDSMASDNVSNSYHRLVRYLKPKENNGGDAAFQAHVDSSFLTLIPMPELPGLEVWCPSKSGEGYGEEEGGGERTQSIGEWVRPIMPFEGLESSKSCNIGNTKESGDCAYVIVMAGEFLQLASDGCVPTCIHRVIPPKPPLSAGTFDNIKYKPRVSAPLFLRPRRGKEALLNVGTDLQQSTLASAFNVASNGIYHEKGLLDECDEMHLWSAHDIVHNHNK